MFLDMMKYIENIILSIVLHLTTFTLAGQKLNGPNAIFTGVTWFDTNGNIISAHGGCIVKDHNRYYFFGEKHVDDNNVFVGFNCYSSTEQEVHLRLPCLGKRSAIQIKKHITYTGNWQSQPTDSSMVRSDIKNARFTINLIGKQVRFDGLLRPDGEDAIVELRSKRQNGITDYNWYLL